MEEKKKGFFGRVFSKDKKSKKEIEGDNFSNKSKSKKLNFKSYEAAQSKNSNFLWTRVSSTEDSEIYKDLESLRARSRDLEKNDPIYKHYLMMLENNVVGKDGFKLQIINSDSDDQNLDIIKSINDSFADWSKSKNCDISKQSDFTSICKVVEKTMAKDGEALVRLIRSNSTPDNPYGFKLQLLDPSRLDLKYNEDLPNGNYVVMGVEFSTQGFPVAYYLRKPQNRNNVYATNYLASDLERVDVNDIMHIFKREYPEQTRGRPWGHSVMVHLKDLSDFHRACLLAGKIGAASSIYLERDQVSKVSDVADDEDEDGNYYSEMGTGEIRALPVGMKLKSFEGKYPSEAYENYTKRMLQLIAGGLGLSQVFLGNDTEDLNYSTARTVILEERNYYETEQKFLINNFVSVIFDEFILQSILNKKIKINNSVNFLKIQDIQSLKFNFIGRKWAAIDPQKEATAAILEYNSMLKPLSQILNEKGLDFVAVLEQYEQDNALTKEILGDNFKLNIVDVSPKIDNSNSQSDENQD